MKCWDEYINYLKDNPKGYWFKNKLYGYGWTPATKAGWATTLFFIIFIIIFAWYSEGSGFVESSPAQFITIVVGSIALLMTICWKTGEPLKWQWGKKNTNK